VFLRALDGTAVLDGFALGEVASRRSAKWPTVDPRATPVFLADDGTTLSLTLADYEASRLVRAGTERQFEIIGEALGRLARIAPEVATRIPDLPVIMAFRNRIIHGYDAIDHATVWGVVERKVPALRIELRRLLDE
jgi:uncharacterized protein with HEPN domain